MGFQIETIAGMKFHLWENIDLINTNPAGEMALFLLLKGSYGLVNDKCSIQGHLSFIGTMELHQNCLMAGLDLGWLPGLTAFNIQVFYRCMKCFLYFVRTSAIPVNLCWQNGSYSSASFISAIRSSRKCRSSLRRWQWATT